MKLGCNRVDLDAHGDVILRHEPERPDVRDFVFTDSKIFTSYRRVVGTESIDFTKYIDQWRVQISGSCVGYDLAQKVFLAAAIEGHPIVFPSPLFICTRARLLGDPPKKPGEPLLTDWGCSPRFAMKAVHETGLVAEARWPETIENINAVPPADAFQEGECATLEAYYKIPDGLGASDQLRVALQRGYPPGFCMIVDEKYVAIGGETYDSPGGNALGGHAQTIVAYDAPRRRFGALSTWGTDVGENGVFWVAADYIDRHAYDMWVVQHSPEGKIQ